MSWTDPCGNCGEHRADCDCGNWNNYKDDQKACLMEPTVRLRFRDVRTQMGVDSYKYVRTLQQMWKDKLSDKTEWRSVELDNS